MTTGSRRPRPNPLVTSLRHAFARHAPRLFLRHATPSRAELGLAGEELAARWLVARGWRLRGRRVTTPEGEVDIWAEYDGRSWVVEVKTGRLHRRPRLRHHPGLPRWELRWRPGLSLDRGQLHRLLRAAHHLGRGSGRSPSVAVIEVLVARDGGAALVLPPVPLTTDFPPRLAEPPR